MYLFISIFFIPSILLSIQYHLHSLQQNFYNENNRYLKWEFSKWSHMFSLSSIFLLIFNLIHFFFPSQFLFFFNSVSLFFFFFQYKRRKKEQVKIPLQITNRLKRLMVTLGLFHMIPFFLVAFWPNYFFFFFFLSFLLTFEFFFVFLANVVNIPIEKYVFHYYKKKAMKKLSIMQHMEVIGITGSYGKTSSKNILNTILGVKYNSFATPKNYNTQYGLILTINQYLDKFEDYFIAEMGAFKKGRIKLLCDMVHPKYGILTSIGTAHLETFGSIKNIQQGKFELIESLPSDGVGILNMDDPNQVQYDLQNHCRIIWIAIQNEKADVIAHNITMDQDGMKFDVFFKKNQITYSFQTKLLGEANIYNILGALALGETLGLSYEELAKGVRKLQPIPHRLELKATGNTIIIDDAYNSNPVGSKMALDVLKLMDGLKVVVTPGMIELGDKQYEYNKNFGMLISEVADYVILIGKEQTKPIVEGLLEKHFDCDKIMIKNDVRDAFPIIDTWKKSCQKTYILLENDLPDIYNE